MTKSLLVRSSEAVAKVLGDLSKSQLISYGMDQYSSDLIGELIKGEISAAIEKIRNSGGRLSDQEGVEKIHRIARNAAVKEADLKLMWRSLLRAAVDGESKFRIRTEDIVLLETISPEDYVIIDIIGNHYEILKQWRTSNKHFESLMSRSKEADYHDSINLGFFDVRDILGCYKMVYGIECQIIEDDLVNSIILRSADYSKIVPGDRKLFALWGYVRDGYLTLKSITNQTRVPFEVKYSDPLCPVTFAVGSLTDGAIRVNKLLNNAKMYADL